MTDFSKLEDYSKLSDEEIVEGAGQLLCSVARQMVPVIRNMLGLINPSLTQFEFALLIYRGPAVGVAVSGKPQRFDKLLADFHKAGGVAKAQKLDEP